MDAWSEFYVATAGASAALAGLVIVAISVNVAEIIKYKALPSRAGAAIGCLVAVLLCSMAGLADQTETAFGVEVIVIGAAAWLLNVKSGIDVVSAGRENHRPAYEAAQAVVIGQLQGLPLIVAGILLIVDPGVGLLTLFGAMLVIVALTMLDAWVLLIEILR